MFSGFEDKGNQGETTCFQLRVQVWWEFAFHHGQRDSDVELQEKWLNTCSQAPNNNKSGINAAISNR